MKKLVFAESIDQVHEWAFENKVRCSEYFVISTRHRCYGISPAEYNPVFLKGWENNRDVMDAFTYLSLNSAWGEKFKKAVLR